MTDGIPNCPECGNEVEVRRLLICGTKVIRCVHCLTEMQPDNWNRYCAAMNLRKTSESAPRLAKMTEGQEDAEQRVEEVLNA
jgi:ribosomal protein L37AE/L43A